MFNTFFDSNVLYTGLEDFYNHCLSLKWYYDTATTNNIYFLTNLPCYPEYHDSFFADNDPLNNESYKTNLFNKYFEFWVSAYSKSLEYLYLYPLVPIQMELINNELFLFRISFSGYYKSENHLSYFLDLNFSNFSKISDFIVLSTNFLSQEKLSITQDNSSLFFFLTYNHFDFEVFLHSLFSMWYPFAAPGFEDYLVNSHTPVYNELNLWEELYPLSKNLWVYEDFCIKNYYLVDFENNFRNFWFDNNVRDDNYTFFDYNLCYVPPLKETLNDNFQDEFDNYFKNLNR